MLKPFTTVLILLLTSQLFGQQRDKMISLAYEGGMITHPGMSAGFLVKAGEKNSWVLQGGVKLGFYYHRRYQTGIFLLPLVQAQHLGNKGRLWGFNIAAGPQRTIIPKSYKINDDGTIRRDKSAGMTQWVFSPGFMFGKDLSERKMLPFQWFINPQLQFRKPTTGRTEKYFILGAGINYKL
jgi:hypothetical protein